MKKGVKITVGVLGIGLAFGLGIGGGYYLSTKNNPYNKDTEISKPSQNNEQIKEEDKKQEVKQLTKDEVEYLYDTLEYFADDSIKNEFFDNTKVTFDTLSTNFKDTLAYLRTQKNEVWDRSSGYKFGLEYSKLNEKLQEEIKKYASMEKYLKSVFGDSYAAAIEVNNTNYSEINKTYKKIFGLDKNMKLENKTNLGIDECIVKYNDFLCVTFEGGYMFNGGDIRFGSAEKIDDIINIYVYRLKLGETNNVGYEDLEKLSDDEYKKYAKKYKSVFKEDYNGNYYWYSTEPIEE